MPDGMLKPVLLAGVMLCVMSTVDTLAYGVRTAGVISRKLAISLSLFNILVMASRWSNLLSAPILGNFPDKVYQGQYSADQVEAALRYCVGFVVLGVALGGVLMPSLIRTFARGIVVLEEQGTLPRTIFYGVRRILGMHRYLVAPRFSQLAGYSDFRSIPYQFLIYNVFVTCFYSIGVMSTVLAASLDHSVASTAILLSGIVNGIATMILFMIVDPPGAVIVEQCISGKRPLKDAKTLNVTLVLTRLLGTLLALVLLPLMAQYVLVTARWVDRVFAADAARVLAKATGHANGMDYEVSATRTSEGELKLIMRVHNPSDTARELTYSSGADFDMALRDGGAEVWRHSAGTRSALALRTAAIGARQTQRFESTVPAADLAGLGGHPLELEVSHLMAHPVEIQLVLDLP